MQLVDPLLALDVAVLLHDFIEAVKNVRVDEIEESPQLLHVILDWGLSFTSNG